jgi:hypothetical protein
MQFQDIDWQAVGKIFDWGLLGFGVKYLASMSGNLAKLNQKIAVLFERAETHEKVIEKHDERITHVERILPVARRK